MLIYVTARHFDRVAGTGAFSTAPAAAEKKQPTDEAPGFYALLPLVPIVLVLVFSPLLVSWIALDVVTAMILGSVIGLVCEVAVKRDLKAVFKGFQVFFNSIGAAFASIVSLLVCADVFAQGLQSIGAVGYMIDSVRDAGFGVNVMAVVMTLMVGATGMITGSGVAAFFAFSGLAPTIATKFGVSAITMVLPMQLMAGMGAGDLAGRRRHHRGQQGGRMLALRDRAPHHDPGLRRHRHHAAGELSAQRVRRSPRRSIVMAGLVPAIHVFARLEARRGCPAQGRA